MPFVQDPNPFGNPLGFDPLLQGMLFYCSDACHEAAAASPAGQRGFSGATLSVDAFALDPCPSEPVSWTLGTYVQLRNLNAAALNYRIARITVALNADGRVGVLVSGSTTSQAIKPANLHPLIVQHLGVCDAFSVNCDTFTPCLTRPAVPSKADSGSSDESAVSLDPSVQQKLIAALTPQAL